MKGSGLFALFLLGSAPCHAQDVFISPAFEHASFTGDGYVNGVGACLGLRFPIGNTRTTIELRPAYVHGTNIIESLNYHREDSRLGAAFGLMRSRDTRANFTWDYGAEAGYYMRQISMQDRSGDADQRSMIIGGMIGVRTSSRSSVQPFLSLHPFYERSLDVRYNTGIEPNNMYAQSQFGLSLCIGLMFGLPSQGPEWN